jgi:hypothetical protein
MDGTVEKPRLVLKRRFASTLLRLHQFAADAAREVEKEQQSGPHLAHPFTRIAATLADAPPVRPHHSQGAFDAMAMRLHPSLQPGLASHVVALGSERDPEQIERILQSLWSKAANHDTHAAQIRQALFRIAYRIPRFAGHGGTATGNALLQFLNLWPEEKR